MEIRDTRNGEWHWVNNAVIACKHLTPHQKTVYSVLCTFAGYSEIHPDYELISEKTGGTVTVRSCKSAIKRLSQIGYIKVDQKVGRGNANVYFLLKAPKGCNHCTISKGANDNIEKVQMDAIKGATIAPHIDKKIDKEKESEQSSHSLPLKETSTTPQNPAAPPWDYKSKLKEMRESKKDTDRLLSYFWKKKLFNFENAKQLSARYTRDCKTAKKITESGYTAIQVMKTFEHVEKKYFEIDWTLETILKALAEANK